MKNQLVSFINWLLTALHFLLLDPQRVRLVLTVIALVVVLAALVVPSLTILADHMGGSGN